MKIDNFYFVVRDIEKSIEFYSKLFDQKPSTITNKRWADWKGENNEIYFGIISEEATGSNLIKGNNGVLGLYTSDINKTFQKCLDLNVKILYSIEEIPNSKDHYKCFAIEDLDGNKIEVASYDKNIKDC